MSAAAGAAVILVVDDRDDALARTAGELERRHGSDYRIVAVRSAPAALASLRTTREEGGEVAVVLADHTPAAGGAALLA